MANYSPLLATIHLIDALAREFLDFEQLLCLPFLFKGGSARERFKADFKEDIALSVVLRNSEYVVVLCEFDLQTFQVDLRERERCHRLVRTPHPARQITH